MRFDDLPLSQCAACADGAMLVTHAACSDPTRRILGDRFLIIQPADLEDWRAVDREHMLLRLSAPTFQGLVKILKEAR